MNIDILKSAGIDYDDGVRRFLGKAQLYTKTLAKFPGEGTIDRIRADYSAGNTAALLADAHEFKGMCGNMSLTRLYQAASAIVALLRSKDYSAGSLGEAMKTLENEYAITRNAVLTATEAGE